MTTQNMLERTYTPTEFNRRIADGLRRAPAERAKAIRDIWNWFSRH